jgi:hypothetical protein
MDRECFVCLEEANSYSPCQCKLPLHHHCYLNLVEYNKSVCAICNEDMYYSLDSEDSEDKPRISLVPCLWRTGNYDHWVFELFYILFYYSVIYIIVSAIMFGTITINGMSLFITTILFLIPCILKK